jgi:glycerate kinase
VFGEQKGLNLEEALKANETLIRWADLLQHESGIDIRDLAGTGAAGGIVAPAIAFLDAEVTSGAEWFANLSHIERAVCEADFVVTGEGSFDQQSLMGKGPGLIIELARKHQKKIFVVAGRVDRKIADTQEVSAISLSEIATSVDDAISNPELWLRHAAHELLKILHV